MATERNEKFWCDVELKLGTFERQWFDDISKSEKDYSMGSSMDDNVEKLVGNHLALVGPMLDSYLHELGACMIAKLSRGRMTGLAVPVNLFIPWQVMRYLVCLCKNYGAKTEYIAPKNKRKRLGKIKVKIEDAETAEKIFNPSRFDGTNYLSKRKFKKVEGVSTYDGMARVVVSLHTPLCMEYAHNHLKVFFLHSAIHC